ncbi:MAG: porin family protein [Pseudomonadales bacterium]|nr:porin family protein [Pseudomonadales bacterium]
MKKDIYLFILLLPLSVLSKADESSLFWGIGIGVDNLEIGTSYDSNLEAGQKIKDNSQFIEVSAGYQLNRNLSIEAKYADYEKMRKTYILSADGIASFFQPRNKEEVEVSKISASMIYSHKIFSNIRLNALMGYSIFNIDRTVQGTGEVGYGLHGTGLESARGLYVGAGAAYEVYDKFQVNFLWSNSSRGQIDTNDFRVAFKKSI